MRKNLSIRSCLTLMIAFFAVALPLGAAEKVDAGGGGVQTGRTASAKSLARLKTSARRVPALRANLVYCKAA
ncbi:hypothetical protein VOM14_22325 [Paraburkholderia sp. MPAMCS5]|uniref:hypothetical protein n=1 Tax=Paraburkholderia sp. MPAMCS5 TaxID=3112563 RepID=UPI002E19B368|nr:hypothetical protein [Paraburkholderia sp. MPAMCS5]